MIRCESLSLALIMLERQLFCVSFKKLTLTSFIDRLHLNEVEPTVPSKLCYVLIVSFFFQLSDSMWRPSLSTTLSYKFGISEGKRAWDRIGGATIKIRMQWSTSLTRLTKIGWKLPAKNWSSCCKRKSLGERQYSFWQISKTCQMQWTNRKYAMVWG